LQFYCLSHDYDIDCDYVYYPFVVVWHDRAVILAIVAFLLPTTYSKSELAISSRVDARNVATATLPKDIMSDNTTSEENCYNLDPAVAVLLEPLSADATKQSLQTRVALIRLQQEHVRGNATYAAKILEQACRDARQDRQTYERLAARLQELEEAVAKHPGDDDDAAKKTNGITSGNSSGETETKDQTSETESSGQAVDTKGNGTKSNNNNDSKEEVRIRELEMLLEERLLLEAAQCQQDLETLKEQEKRLRDRIKSLRNVATHHSSSNDQLQQAVAALNDCVLVGDGSTAAECIVCQCRAAVRAIVPCGHLCLCDACTPQLVEHSGAAAVPHCPLCRGPTLSTLKIYYAAAKLRNCETREVGGFIIVH